MRKSAEEWAMEWGFRENEGAIELLQKVQRDAAAAERERCIAECRLVMVQCGRFGGDDGDFHEFGTGAKACIQRINALGDV